MKLQVPRGGLGEMLIKVIAASALPGVDIATHVACREETGSLSEELRRG